jgi:hypothetical protein
MCSCGRPDVGSKEEASELVAFSSGFERGRNWNADLLAVNQRRRIFGATIALTPLPGSPFPFRWLRDTYAKGASIK